MIDTLSLDFLIPLEKMKQIQENNFSAKYAKAFPFPYCEISDFFDPVVLEKVLEEFPEDDDPRWFKMDSYHQLKRSSKEENLFGPLTRRLFHQLNSNQFINFLEAITGITGLIPDPHFNGGGLHCLTTGGKLGVHADFNREPRLKLDRRINVLIYLNKDWKLEYGGALELWDKSMKQCHQKIIPEFNKLAIFSTTDFSFHGNPQPISEPNGRSRRSLALYYYTNGRPPEETSKAHTTLFKLRPGEKMRWKTRQVIRKLVPPVVYDIRDFIFQSNKK